MIVRDSDGDGDCGGDFDSERRGMSGPVISSVLLFMMVRIHKATFSYFNNIT